MTFRVVFERDEDGWHVSIPALKGCHTWGRSLSEARANIREALSLFEEELDGKAVEVAGAAILSETVRWPRGVRAAYRKLQRARERMAAAESEANEAVREITKEISLRDAGELIGFSHEGVRKMLKAG